MAAASADAQHCSLVFLPERARSVPVGSDRGGFREASEALWDVPGCRCHCRAGASEERPLTSADIYTVAAVSSSPVPVTAALPFVGGIAERRRVLSENVTCWCLSGVEAFLLLRDSFQLFVFWENARFAL